MIPRNRSFMFSLILYTIFQNTYRYSPKKLKHGGKKNYFLYHCEIKKKSKLKSETVFSWEDTVFYTCKDFFFSLHLLFFFFFISIGIIMSRTNFESLLIEIKKKK